MVNNKNRFPLLGTLCLACTLSPPIFAEPEESTCEPAIAGYCRDWTIVDDRKLEDPENHSAATDTFKIARTGVKVRLFPNRELKNRWPGIGNPELTIVTNEGSVQCLAAKLQLKNAGHPDKMPLHSHAPQTEKRPHQVHRLNLFLIGESNSLSIDWVPLPNADEEPGQCGPRPEHLGRAHATESLSEQKDGEV